jgi:hypothetical protein
VLVSQWGRILLETGALQTILLKKSGHYAEGNFWLMQPLHHLQTGGCIPGYKLIGIYGLITKDGCWLTELATFPAWTYNFSSYAALLHCLVRILKVVEYQRVSRLNVFSLTKFNPEDTKFARIELVGA